MPADPRPRNEKHHATDWGTIKIDWASDKQRELFEYGPYPVCASGGFGSAKTYAFCLKALWLSFLFPCNRGVIARKVFAELQQTTMRTFYKICPPRMYLDGGRRADSEKYLRLNNGSEILFMHLDNAETEAVIRGLEINWCFLDQCEEIDEQLFDLISSRLGRWDRVEVPQWLLDQYAAEGRNYPWMNPQTRQPGVPTYMMIACNPDVETHWIYRRFHPESEDHWDRRFLDESGEPYSYHDLGYRLWTMDSRENKYLSRQNIDALMQKDESFVRRYVRGEWGIPEGTIHEVNPLSILEPEPDLLDFIRRHCTLHRALDHGDAAPTCCLWSAVDAAGNVYMYREYYKPNELVSTHRLNICKLSGKEKYRSNLADPSIFYTTRQSQQGMRSVADEYGETRQNPRHTAIFWRKACNDELGTRNRINEYLRVDPDRVHPVTGEKGSPRLFFVKRSVKYPEGCFHAIKETRSQRRLQIGSDLGRPIFSDDRNEDIVDHAYDCVRYTIAGRPPVPLPKLAAPNPMSLNEVVRRHDAWMRRGGFKQQARIMRRRAALFGY